jgi:hypothetical protein
MAVGVNERLLPQTNKTLGFSDQQGIHRNKMPGFIQIPYSYSEINGLASLWVRKDTDTLYQEIIKIT